MLMAQFVPHRVACFMTCYFLLNYAEVDDEVGGGEREKEFLLFSFELC